MTAQELTARITEYLSLGGLWSPDLMEHDKVRDLLIDCRAFLAAPLTRVDAAVPSPIQAERPHKDEIRPWRWHSSMDDVAPETGQRAENVPVRSPDKGGAAGNGVAAGAERRVVHPASPLPQEAAPSALDVASELREEAQAHPRSTREIFERGAAALEREHARANGAERDLHDECVDRAAQVAILTDKIVALEAALRAADEMHKQGQRHYHGEPERRTCPMCATMDAYRAARDAP